MPLLIIRETGCERFVEIERDRITIGSSKANTVFMTSPNISPRHCILEKTPHGWFVTDLGSGGGTRLNGRRVLTGLVTPGDVISAGEASIHFERERGHDDTPDKIPWWMRKAAPALVSAGAHLIVLWIAAYIIFTVIIPGREQKPPPEIVVHRKLPSKEFEPALKPREINVPRVEGMVQMPVVTLEEEIAPCEEEAPRGTSFHDQANKNLDFTGYIDAFGLGGGRAGAFGQRATFFGGTVETTEAVFVIDRSGSMAWGAKEPLSDNGENPAGNPKKIDLARRELLRAIDSLSRNMKFAIVCYSTGQVDAWPQDRKLAKATALNKASARRWVEFNLDSWMARGDTNTHEAMAAAFEMTTPPRKADGKSPTGVYLLTDGAPTTVEEKTYWSGSSVRNWNRGRECIRVTKLKILADNVHGARIYTYGMGMDMAVPQRNEGERSRAEKISEKCRQFLKEIAQATGGSYREVPAQDEAR